MAKISTTLLILLSFMLTACQAPMQAAPTPTISFAGSKPFVFDVANVTVMEEFMPTLHAPHVEHLFSPTPAQAIRIWAKDRVAAGGQSRMMRVVIKDASVTMKPLPKKTTGLKGVFTKEQTSLYEGRIAVKLEVYDKDPLFPAVEVNMEVARSETLGEDATLNERNALYSRLTQQMITDLDKTAEINIPLHLNKYIMNP
jgi:hypothetical protein